MPATLHFVQFAGENTHHILEACFKGAGHALAAAVAIEAAHRDEIPSTKDGYKRQDYRCKSIGNAIVGVYTALNLTGWWPVTAIAWVTA